MRELVISGRVVNLKKETTVSFVWENPFLTEGRVPIPASMDFQLDPTPTNLLVFGNPNRLTSKINVADQPATFKFGPITLFEGVAKYNGYDKTIKTHLRSVERANLNKRLCDLPLERVNFRNGTRYSWYHDPRNAPNPVEGWGYDTYTPILKEVLYGDKNWVWAPVRTGSEPNFHLSYVGFCGYFSNGTEATVTRGTTCRNPYPRLHYLFDIIFDGLLVVNPLKADKFKNLVLPTMFHKSYPSIRSDYSLGMYVLDNAVTTRDLSTVEMLYFNLASFMPVYRSGDLVKETLKILGMVLFPVSRKYVIKTVEEIVAGTSVVNWHDKLIGELESDIEPGVILDVRWNDISEVEGATIKVASAIDIFDIPTTLDESYLVEVISNGEIYEITKSSVTYQSNPERGTTVTGTYTVFDVELKRAFFSAPANISDEKEKFSISIDVKPYSNTITYKGSEGTRNWSTGEVIKQKDSHWYCSENLTDMKSREYVPSIMHYIGITDAVVAGQAYPQITAHAVDCRGRRVAEFSLEPWGPDGIVEKFYPSYRTWLAKDRRRVSGVFNLSALDLSNLDMSLKYSINNVNFFIEKVEVDIAHDRISPARVSLIEA